MTSRRGSRGRLLLDLGIVFAGCLGAGVLFATQGNGTLGLLGIPLLLFVPGYLVSSWLGDRKLARLERLTLAVALSLSLAAMFATVLATTASGLTPQSFAGALLVLILALGIGLLARGSRAGDGPIRRVVLRWRDAASLIIGGALTVAAITISVTTVTDMATAGVLQLYLEPAAGPEAPHTIAASNQGFDTLHCAAEWTPAAGSADSSSLSWPEFSLGTGELWRAQLPIGGESPASSQAADVTLSCQGADTQSLVRSLHLWVR